MKWSAVMSWTAAPSWCRTRLVHASTFSTPDAGRTVTYTRIVVVLFFLFTPKAMVRFLIFAFRVGARFIGGLERKAGRWSEQDGGVGRGSVEC